MPKPSSVLERMGNTNEARADLEEALGLFESIGSAKPTKDLRKRLERLALPRRTANSK